MRDSNFSHIKFVFDTEHKNVWGQSHDVTNTCDDVIYLYFRHTWN